MEIKLSTCYTNAFNKTVLFIALSLASINIVLACSYDDAIESEGTLFVSNAGSNDSACGFSKATACASINTAIKHAADHGLLTNTTIHVAPGTYDESVAITQTFDGITIQGSGQSGACRSQVTAQNNTGFNAPAGVPVSYGFLIIHASHATVSGFAIKFTNTVPGDELEREIGVFLARPAKNATIHANTFIRATNDERLSGPGSRGIFTIQGGGHNIHHNQIACEGDGAFEDGIHIPDHDVNIHHNEICNANRIGIVTIQETGTSNSDDNKITHNTVSSAPTGIEIQGDDNKVNQNTIGLNVDTGIVVCGTGCGCHYVPSNPANSGDQIAENTMIKLSEQTTISDCGLNTVIN